MGITNKCNIEEDQLLAEEIRKYPCLYNKAERSYLDQTMKESAWRNVDAAMGYGQGKCIPIAKDSHINNFCQLSNSFVAIEQRALCGLCRSSCS